MKFSVFFACFFFLASNLSFAGDYPKPEHPHHPGNPGQCPHPENPCQPPVYPTPAAPGVWLRQEFYGFNRLNLSQLINVFAFQGYRLGAVNLSAASRGGFSQATFCGTFQCYTANFGPQLTSFRFPASGEWVDSAAYNWNITLNGYFFIDAIQLEFFR